MVEFRSKLYSSKSQTLDKMAFKKLLLWVVLFSVIIIAVGVIGIVFKEDESDFIVGISLIVFGLIFTPFCYLLTYILSKAIDKSATYIGPDTEEIYTFDEQYFTLTQISEDVYSATLKAKYSYIYKAREDKNYYYLYISKMQCHVIDKASITQGTLDELRALLKTNLGNKFKSK